MKLFSISLFFHLCLTLSIHTAWSQATLSGKINNIENWNKKIYITNIPNFYALNAGYDGYVVDSISIQPDGTFKKHTPQLAPGIYRLNIQPKGASVMAAIALGVPNENFLFVCVENPGDEITLELDAEQFNQNYKIIQGTPRTKIIRQIQDLRNDYFEKMKVIYSDFERQTTGVENPDTLLEIRKRAIGRLKETGEIMQKNLRPFIDTTATVEAGLIAAMYYNLGDDFSKYAPYFDSLYNKWIGICGQYNCFLVEDFGKMVYEFQGFVPIGSQVPDITLPDTANNLISLYNVNAEIILIDFWASWCGPCRQDAKFSLMPLYTQYKDLGFEIFGVSTDKKPAAWQKALEMDGYTWINTIDQADPDGATTADFFKVKQLPTSYLINKEKKIIAKNLKGPGLEVYLENYFKNN